MTIKIAINGYGRIGRNILRALYESGRKDLQIVAVNDLGDVATNVHLTKYDTAHGKFPGTVAADGDSLVVNGDRIKVLAVRNRPKRRGRRSVSTSCTSAPACSPARPRRRLTSTPAPRK
jgi:glyceraldehyde-3-phosphate dehydrogenase/erythrose-4-phosphate dehydrogenase